jgi:hypothetical protein
MISKNLFYVWYLRSDLGIWIHGKRVRPEALFELTIEAEGPLSPSKAFVEPDATVNETNESYWPRLRFLYLMYGVDFPSIQGSDIKSQNSKTNC